MASNLLRGARRSIVALVLFLALAGSAVAAPDGSVPVGPSSLDRLGPHATAWVAGALAEASPSEKKAWSEGTLPLSTFYSLAAKHLFPGKTASPVTYVALKNALVAQGLGDDLGRLVSDLPRAQRDALLDGKLSPAQVFSNEAGVRGDWRSSSRPAPLERIEADAERDGSLAELKRGLAQLAPEQRAAAARGELSPSQLVSLIQDADLHHPDVVIVGAGIAGIEAARQLTAEGKRVVILEAGDQIGGRVRTDGSTFGQPLDAGGAWIHNSTENPTMPIAQKLGLTLVRDVPTNKLVWNGRGLAPLDEHALESFEERASAASTAAADSRRDVSVGSLMNEPGDEALGVFVANVHHGVSTGNDISAGDYAHMTAETEDRLVREGMQTIPEALSWGLPIETGKPVSRIEQTSNGVRVHSGSEVYTASKVIVTTSPAVLATGAIQFSPALPDWKTRAFSDLPMGKYGKVILEFDRNVFDKVPAGTRIYDTTNPDGVVEYVVRPFGDNVVVALAGGKLSDEIEAKGRDRAVADTRAQLGRIFGASAVEGAFKAGAITTWATDPLTRGSFSAARPGAYDARALAGKPVGDIYFAGEAVAEPKWNATIAGGFLSGDVAAKAVESALDARASSPLAALLGGETDPEKLAEAIRARGAGAPAGEHASLGFDRVLDERLDAAKDRAGVRGER